MLFILLDKSRFRLTGLLLKNEQEYFYPFSATKIPCRNAPVKSENTLFYTAFYAKFLQILRKNFAGFALFFCVKYAEALPVAAFMA